EEWLVGLQALDEEARDGVTEKVVPFIELDDMFRCRPRSGRGEPRAREINRSLHDTASPRTGYAQKRLVSPAHRRPRCDDETSTSRWCLKLHGPAARRHPATQKAV